MATLASIGVGLGLGPDGSPASAQQLQWPKPAAAAALLESLAAAYKEGLLSVASAGAVALALRDIIGQAPKLKARCLLQTCDDAALGPGGVKWGRASCCRPSAGRG